MNQTHGRGDLVDVLTARAAGVKGNEIIVFIADHHLVQLLKFWHDFNGSEGSVSASRRVKRGNAHQSVHAVFAFEISVGVLALDKNRCRFQSRFISVQPVGQFVLEPMAVTPACDHAVEHLAPVLCLGAACAGVEGNNCVIPVILPAEQCFDPLVFRLFGDFLEFRLDFLHGILVVFFNCHFR